MKDIQSAQLKVNACPCPLKQAELALLTLLPLAHVQHCLQVQDVALSDGNTVHCAICGSEQSPPLLLLRDCVGAELVLWRGCPLQGVLGGPLGMGRSSRPLALRPQQKKQKPSLLRL